MHTCKVQYLLITSNYIINAAQNLSEVMRERLGVSEIKEKVRGKDLHKHPQQWCCSNR